MSSAVSERISSKLALFSAGFLALKHWILSAASALIYSDSALILTNVDKDTKCDNVISDENARNYQNGIPGFEENENFSSKFFKMTAKFQNFRNNFELSSHFW